MVSKTTSLLEIALKVSFGEDAFLLSLSAPVSLDLLEFLRQARSADGTLGILNQPLKGLPSARAICAALVTGPGTLQRFPAAVHSTRTRAIGVATITVPADPHLHTAACAAVEPIGIFAHRTRSKGLDNAVHRGHKGNAAVP
ncbi:MAG: hypothetical protein L0Y67_05215 [Gammaproteobacteria bacterium]|nr:hypothetical protein [Gammaproteobacteria bacterium]